jgi:hypothetical protein
VSPFGAVDAAWVWAVRELHSILDYYTVVPRFPPLEPEPNGSVLIFWNRNFEGTEEPNGSDAQAVSLVPHGSQYGGRRSDGAEGGHLRISHTHSTPQSGGSRPALPPIKQRPSPKAPARR